MERVAVADLGSNSWRLVVYGYEPGTPWWSPVDEPQDSADGDLAHPRGGAVGADHADVHHPLADRLPPARLAGEVVVERPADPHGRERRADLGRGLAQHPGGGQDHGPSRSDDHKIDQRGEHAAVVQLGPGNGHGGCTSHGVHTP